MKADTINGSAKTRKLLVLGSMIYLLLAAAVPVLAAGYEPPPGWADRGNMGEPPGWSQVNPGAGGSDGPAQGPKGVDERELDSVKSWPDAARPPGWSHQNPGAGGSDGPAEGPQGNR